MKKIIVTTTINQPTEAINIYDSLRDWLLIVIGDLKTPKDYKLRNGIYFSPADQEKRFGFLSELIGWNCIQRRNIGFLLALDLGADYIATIDDDNIPLQNWGDVLIDKPISHIKYELSNICFDPLSVTEHRKLWHRGFPIQHLNNRSFIKKHDAVSKFDIQANFWNGDPDVDAICRMEHAPDVTFDSFIPFSSNKISPFNSQNTILSRKAIKDYFMFPGIGRMDDIWASFYLQSLGYLVFYCNSTVVQKRNLHDLTVDFNNEIIGYQKNVDLISDLYLEPLSISKYIPKSSFEAFKEYKRIVNTFGT